MRAMSEPLHLVDTTMFWSPTGGGVRRYLQTKHDWLAAQPRWRHSIAVPRVAGSGADATTLPSIALPGSGGYRLPLRRSAIARVLVGLAPDLIEVGDPYRVAWGARDAAQQLGIPAVAYCHSNIAAMARLAGGRRLGAAAARWAARYARHVYGGFDLILAPSRSMEAHLRDWGVDRVACQPLGVDTAVFRPQARDGGFRAARGWRDDARVLVYAGRFAPEKHLDVLADAVAPPGRAVRLLVVGAGRRRHRGRAGRRAALRRVGGELATVLASADAFVHAGDQETFGLSVLEAMACGTPAVVRDAEGLGELADGGAAIAVAGGSSADFAPRSNRCSQPIARRSRRARRTREASDWQHRPARPGRPLRARAGEAARRRPRPTCRQGGAAMRRATPSARCASSFTTRRRRRARPACARWRRSATSRATRR